MRPKLYGDGRKFFRFSSIFRSSIQAFPSVSSEASSSSPKSSWRALSFSFAIRPDTLLSARAIRSIERKDGSRFAGVLMSAPSSSDPKRWILTRSKAFTVFSQQGSVP